MLKFHLVVVAILSAVLALAEPLPMPAGAWRNHDDSLVSLTEKGGILEIKVEKSGKVAGAASKNLKTFPTGMLVLSGAVQCEVPGGAFLQVKLFKGKQELSRSDSLRLKSKSGKLSVEFDSTGADRIQVLCRVSCTEKYLGTIAQFSDLTLTPKSELTPDLPAFKLVPGYEVCSIVLNSRQATSRENFQSEVCFREEGASEWIKALPLAYDPKDRRAGGSLLTLKENTAYELKLALDDNGKKEVIEKKFRTRSSRVPIAKTIELDASTKLPLVIRESGKPDGYIRYIAKPGVVLDGGTNSDEVIRLNGVENIILEGLTVRGGRINTIVLDDVAHIQVFNCDISNYGRVGVRRPDLDGKYFIGDQAIDHDTGILIHNSRDILIERNYIHDPRGTGSSWFYSHPAGPSAILSGGAEQTTIRYNDFVGSDLHRWSDAVEGLWNYSIDGSVCRDAEIIGNYFAFGDDDGMELDGGQQNCRFMFNKCEGFLCALSTAPCLIGPSYIVGNLFSDPGDELGVANTAIKNNYPRETGRGLLHFIHNTIVGEHGAMSGYGGKVANDPQLKSVFKVYSRNNVAMVTGGMMLKDIFLATCDFDYDLWYSGKQSLTETIRKNFNQEAHGITKPAVFTDVEQGIYTLAKDSPGIDMAEPIPGLVVDSGRRSMGMLHDELPYRPIPFQVNVGKVFLNSLSATPVSITLTVDDPNFKSEFRIMRNDSGRFFKVEPESGVLTYGSPVTLTVSADPAEVASARLNSGAFLIRLPNGFSRPVSVYVDSREDDARLAQDRAQVIRGEITSNGGDSAEIRVEVPKDGIYFMFVRVVKDVVLTASLDGGEELKLQLGGRYHRDEERWRPLGKSTLTSKAFPLTAGKHTISLHGLQGALGGFALAQTPEELLLAPKRP